MGRFKVSLWNEDVLAAVVFIVVAVVLPYLALALEYIRP